VSAYAPGVTSDAEVRTARFADLSATLLYDVLRLRVDVFVVEQGCAYPDLDGRDTEPGTEHVWLEDAAGPTAYLRVLREPDAIRIGRVCTRADARGAGAAAHLVEHTLRRHPHTPVVLDAQAYLVDFYARLGFTPSGSPFVEDGIPHVPMRRQDTPAQGS
jgi:ElaA protein